MRAADPRRNRGVEKRSFSRSAAAAEADATSVADGFRAGLASSGFMYCHLASLSVFGGRPWPNPLSAPVQSSMLNQSPESYELRSSDLLRSRSAPACQNDGVCASAVVASDRGFMRPRSCIDGATGGFYVSESKSVSLSWAST